MIATNMKQYLNKHEYSADKVSEWLSSIFVGILNSLVPLGQHFKYCITGTITQNCGAGFHQFTYCRLERQLDSMFNF